MCRWVDAVANLMGEETSVCELCCKLSIWKWRDVRLAANRSHGNLKYIAT